jgi:hypothetical protein
VGVGPCPGRDRRDAGIPPPSRFARHLPLKEVEELRSHCSPAGELPAERGEGALRRLGSPLRPGACAPVHLPLKRWRNWGAIARLRGSSSRSGVRGAARPDRAEVDPTWVYKVAKHDFRVVIATATMRGWRWRRRSNFRRLGECHLRHPLPFATSHRPPQRMGPRRRRGRRGWRTSRSSVRSTI